MMVIGLKYGHSGPADELAKEWLYKLTNEYLADFESKCGSTSCNKLLSVDISTQDGINKAINNNSFSTICPNAIKTSSEIIEKMFAENI